MCELSLSHSMCVDKRHCRGYHRSMNKLRNRFWSKVQVGRDDECWLWLAAKTRSNRGVFRVFGLQVSAPRVAYALYYGRWPELYVLHSCDNPACVNPSHLREGSQFENMQDMRKKGRQNYVGSHKVSLEDVKKIRSLRKEGKKLREIAQLYNLSLSGISRICSMSRWKN